jgi:prephenate dehydrogenase
MIDSLQCRRGRGAARLFDCVGIDGVGLIGGSIGLALKQRSLARRVIGFGRSEEKLRRAQALSAIDEFSLSFSAKTSELDLLVLCAPVDRIVERGVEAAERLRPDAVITDAGSTKGRIVHEMEERLRGRRCFVGSHPMAGSEKQGVEHASASLFEGKLCAVTPTSAVSLRTLQRVVAFWNALGMKTLTMTPDEHDWLVGRTSHLPHLAASALAMVAGEAGRRLAGNGLLDTTRIASGDPAIWAPIFEQNKTQVLAALDEFLGRLRQFRERLASEDQQGVERFLADGKANRDALGR